MKELTISLAVASLLAVTLGPTPTIGIYKNICRLFADGVQLRDPYACDAYITCIDSVEVSTKCANGQLFSIESKKCVASTDACENPCAPDYDNIWATDPKSCNGYYFCNNGSGIFGMCSNELHFSEDKQECVYASNSDCEGDNYCHIVPNSINFADETACDKYYVCEKGVLKSKACSSGYLYTRDAGSCLKIAEAKGCDSLPTSVCVKSKKPEKNKFVADTVTCRGYYYCADKGDVADDNPSWGQCPDGLFFNYSDQMCEDPTLVACDGDRCDGRGNLFVNSSGGCQNYLVCKNGKTVESRTCAGQLFFDEKRQACTSEVIEYTACV